MSDTCDCVCQAVAILPAGNRLHGNAPLLAGVRTGFCGSLTTFSAWQLQNVLLLVGGRGRDGGQWAQVLQGGLKLTRMGRTQASGR